MANLEKISIFKQIYYNSRNPGSFGSQNKLLLEAKKIRNDITLKDVKDWLSGELVYSLHKPIVRKFKRNPMVSEQPNLNMQADLVDMKEFETQNDGYQYLLTAIDIFSKKAFAIAIKNKGQVSVTKAMKKILDQHNTLELMTDRGTEFTNRLFKKLIDDYKINHYFANNQGIKCSIIERFNRTLKNKMFKYFTLRGNRKYINELDNFLVSYNNSKHRSIKMTPNQVNSSNIKQVFKNLYGFPSKREMLKKKARPKLSTGDTVRLPHKIGVHDRGYYPNWADQIHKVFKAMHGLYKPYYMVKDENEVTQNRKYYPNEVQKVKPTLFRIEKVLKHRKYKGKKQIYVKWLNHPDSFNSWIDSSNLTNING